MKARALTNEHGTPTEPTRRLIVPRIRKTSSPGTDSEILTGNELSEQAEPSGVQSIRRVSQLLGRSVGFSTGQHNRLIQVESFVRAHRTTLVIRAHCWKWLSPRKSGRCVAARRVANPPPRFAPVRLRSAQEPLKRGERVEKRERES